ncbi:MAG: SIS domain-containing protein [Dehalococcoidia bacterium]|nr:SIS domain-containing protein [Dehalococcoidia bacterium]
MSATRDKRATVAKQIEESASLCVGLASQTNVIVQIADEMIRAFRHGRKVLLFGNGGSAADAEHIACELSGKFTLFRDPLPAIALTTNTSALTAIGNDFGYEEVFARQLKGLVAEGDVVIGLSTSGTSSNVIKAMEEASRRGAITVAFTGDRGRLKEIANYALSVASTNTPRIQEGHMLAGHIICGLVEKALFGTPASRKARRTCSR